VRPKYTIPTAAAALFISCLAPAVAHAEPTPPPGPPPGPGAAEAGPPPGPGTAEAGDAAVPDGGIAGSGTFQVGKDVFPGTYRSAGPADAEGTCYWKRSNGDTLVDNAMSKKQQVVKIEATDTSFKSSDCAPWQKIDDCLPGCGPAPINPADLLSQLGKIMMNRPPAG
jgi:hypothetical protein